MEAGSNAEDVEAGEPAEDVEAGEAAEDVKTVELPVKMGKQVEVPKMWRQVDRQSCSNDFTGE